MICPRCGRESGWHSVECQAVNFATCGMGTYARELRVALTIDDELEDCAIEGIATIEHAEERAA